MGTRSEEEKFCKPYKKLTDAADNDKELSRTECGKMVFADSECKSLWFAQKQNGTRCYCCTDENQSASEFWQSDTMNMYQIKKCVDQAVYEERQNAAKEARKQFDDAFEKMDACFNDKWKVCVNNYFIKYDRFEYEVGEGLVCKETTYLSEINGGNSKAPCVGYNEGYIYA